MKKPVRFKIKRTGFLFLYTDILWGLIILQPLVLARLKT